MLVLTFQVGGERLALDLHRVLEVVPRVRLARSSGVPDWHAGVFVYRGGVVPVVDLHCLAGAEPCLPHLSSRIVLVAPRRGPGRERVIGLLASHAVDTRELSTTSPPNTKASAGAEPDFGTLVADGNGVIRLFDPDCFLPEKLWQTLLGASRGAVS